MSDIQDVGDVEDVEDVEDEEGSIEYADSEEEEQTK